jgi:phosphate:Na+ symporter
METPPVALAGAAREALRITDTLETLLNGAADSLGVTDRKRIAETRKLDDVIDRLGAAIKTYLSALDPDSLADADHKRLAEILTFITNLEAAGDVIDRDIMGHIQQRLKRGLPAPEAERDEMRRLATRLIANLRAASAVFMTEDVRAARLLVAEKEAFRDLEAAATTAHFKALRTNAEGGEASQIHLDLVRDLQRVNGLLVAAAAYPLLESQGELLPSRLRIES